MGSPPKKAQSKRSRPKGKTSKRVPPKRSRRPLVRVVATGIEVPDERTLWQIDPNFRATLEALDTEAFALLDEWIVYQDLFGRDQERIDLFNETAPRFFGLLQFSMLDSVIAQICRITDPHESGREVIHEHLSLRRVGVLAKPRHPKVARQLNKAAERIDELCKPCRDWRNKKVSHLDLATHLDAKNSPLKVTRKNVGDAVDAIKAYLNTAREKLAAGEFYYDEVYRQEGVKPLLRALIEAVQFRALAKEQPETFRLLLRDGKFGSLLRKLEDGEQPGNANEELADEVVLTIDLYERLIGRPATRTRNMIADQGEIKALSNLMVSADLQQGFKVLRDRRQLDKTFEALVVRFRREFSSEVVEAAQWRLDHPNDLL
jgi:hypothetical protein